MSEPALEAEWTIDRQTGAASLDELKRLSASVASMVLLPVYIDLVCIDKFKPPVVQRLGEDAYQGDAMWESLDVVATDRGELLRVPAHRIRAKADLVLEHLRGFETWSEAPFVRDTVIEVSVVGAVRHFHGYNSVEWCYVAERVRYGSTTGGIRMIVQVPLELVMTLDLSVGTYSVTARSYAHEIMKQEVVIMSWLAEGTRPGVCTTRELIMNAISAHLATWFARIDAP